MCQAEQMTVLAYHDKNHLEHHDMLVLDDKCAVAQVSMEWLHEGQGR